MKNKIDASRREIVRMRNKMAAASPRNSQEEKKEGCYFAEKMSG
jgi:hypothetical protein